MTVNEKIKALRANMQAQGVDAYIIPSSDPHQSEYLADHWKCREWISGFTGSAGTVVITADHAGLWTDVRYFLQAEEQLKGTVMELHKLNIPHTPQHRDWIKQNLPIGSKVGLDGRLFSVGQVRQLAKDFHGKKIDLATDLDLISDIWKERPTLPLGEIFEHEVKFAGVSRSDKLASLREKMDGVTHYLLSTLDDIAWLFNLRGRDVESNPVFYAHTVVGHEVAWLFIENEKVSAALKTKLNADGVLLKPYDGLENFLQNLPKPGSIHIDLGSVSNQVFNAVDKERLVEGKNFCQVLKSIKNPVEIEHFRQVMVKDGVALVKLFRWLESELENRAVPEIEVAEQLASYRSKEADYFGESFHAIVGYQGNGAVIHYHPEAGKCADIRPEGILLLDSGGQYLDGTTDITRTIALSEPTNEQKRDYTLVLKGHIGLALAKFPEGTTGVQLDTLARMHLWQHGLNFGHGTGHGVGFFNAVHEGPQGFSPVPHTPRANFTIDPGSVTSNEPGFYKTGEYGIRIENLLLCVEDRTGWEDRKYYRFETITLFPIDLTLVAENMLTSEERAWLNEYHETVFEKISPRLDASERAWLREKCGKI